MHKFPIVCYNDFVMYHFRLSNVISLRNADGELATLAYTRSLCNKYANIDQFIVSSCYLNQQIITNVVPPLYLITILLCNYQAELLYTYIALVLCYVTTVIRDMMIICSVIGSVVLRLACCSLIVRGTH